MVGVHDLLMKRSGHLVNVETVVSKF